MVETEYQQRFTRRQLLQGSAAGATGVVLSGLFPASTQEISFCDLGESLEVVESSEESVRLRKEALRNEYGVEAVETYEAYNLLGMNVAKDSVVTDPPLGMMTRAWSDGTLTLLYNILKYVPGHMYEEVDGEKVYFALDYLHIADCQCAGVFGADLFPEITHNPDVIRIDPQNILPVKNRDMNRVSGQIVIHELSHRYDLDVMHGQVTRSIARAFGEDFRTVASTNRDILAGTDLNRLTPMERLAASKLEYAFRAEHQSFKELTASSAEMFMFGDEDYKSGMTYVLGEEMADKLYKITKEQLFLGIEYRKFPTIC
jgi:hypothetical protein